MAYSMLYVYAEGRKAMGTTKTATARALIDPEVKRQAESILKELVNTIAPRPSIPIRDTLM